MSEPTEQEIETLRYVAARLRGVRIVIGSGKKDDASVLALALMSCPEHHGRHHFAVIGEGAEIAMSQSGYDCLRAQGVEV